MDEISGLYGSLIRANLSYFESRLAGIAEGEKWNSTYPADQALESIGLLEHGELTDAGIRYYEARLVARVDDAEATILGDLLRQNVIVNTFCGRLWPYQKVPVAGAISLLKRLTAKITNDLATKGLHPKAAKDFASDFPELLLDLMNLAHLVAHEEGYVRILYNPNELAPQKDGAELERGRGHVIDPKTPYGNVLALKEMIGGARQSIRWYEQHMPAKVLEVLYREIDGQKVASIRLLSGPANIPSKDDFKRFREEMASERKVDAQWRVLAKDEARVRHGRFFITEGFSRNLPPLNAILEGTVDEILPSQMTAKDFDEWWAVGQDIASYQAPAKPAT